MLRWYISSKCYTHIDSKNSLTFSIPLHLINYTNIRAHKRDCAFKPRKSESEWYKGLPHLMRCLCTPPSQGRKCSHSSIMGVNRLYQLFFPLIVSVMFVWLSRFRSKSSALASPGSAPTRACSPSQANGLSMGFLCVLLVTVVTQAGWMEQCGRKLGVVRFSPSPRELGTVKHVLGHCCNL